MVKHIAPWTWVILSSAIAAILLMLMPGDAQIQATVALWFFLVCPGMMLVRFFRLDDPVFEWTLAVVLSLAVDTFIAGALLYAHLWTPTGAFWIVLALTVGGTLLYEADAARAQRSALQ
jgi:hypothetical protein